MTSAALITWLVTTALPIVAASIATHIATKRAVSGPNAPVTGPLGGQFLPNHPVLMNLWQALAQAAPLLMQPQNQPPLQIPLPANPAQPAQPQVDLVALLHKMADLMAQQQPVVKPPDPPKV